MTRWLLLLAASTCLSGAAVVAETCTTHRALCESVCTPDRIWRDYGGSALRCSASCEPRWQACLRTGIWVDLERLSSGGWEHASGL